MDTWSLLDNEASLFLACFLFFQFFGSVHFYWEPVNRVPSLGDVHQQIAADVNPLAQGAQV